MQHVTETRQVTYAVISVATATVMCVRWRGEGMEGVGRRRRVLFCYRVARRRGRDD